MKESEYYDLAYLTLRILRRCERPGAYYCWTWKGASTKRGYGRVKFKGKLYLPHRVIAVHAGIVNRLADPKRKSLVLHHCDNPKCCNPRHLFAGTLSSNMVDCAAKGRLGAQRRSR